MYALGNGYKCEISHSCDNSCDVNAECIFDTSSRGYVCQCKKGWTGDGQTCQQTSKVLFYIELFLFYW